MTLKLTRRAALAAGAVLPFAAGPAPTMTLAAGHSTGPKNAIQNTFSLGSFQVATLLAGTRVVEGPQNIFGMNVSPEEFAQASTENFIPADKTRFFFTPTVVNTGSEVVLFDTGPNAAGTLPALARRAMRPRMSTWLC